MIVQQYQLPCLSISSFLVGDERTGAAVVIDPQRDISQYLRDTEEKGLAIEHVLLTHFHADYVSGHLELATVTGAEICLGEAAEAEFAIRNLADGERILLGDVAIEAWATPGHTPESVSYLLYERSGDESPVAVFTGDTLFVGDVGRPDLLGAIGYTADQLGAQLYDSVHRLIGLPDAVRVYPGHGAGSACGKQLGSDPFTTIGQQKESNYALQPMSREAFVELVTEGQPAAPPYFLHDAITNRREHEVFDEGRLLDPIDIETVIVAQDRGAVVLDARNAHEFAAGHLRGAVNVPIEGRFAEQAGAVITANADVIVATDAGREQEAMVRLGRIGFDRVIGYIPDPEIAFANRPDRVARAERMDVGTVTDLGSDDVQLVDVRNPGETADGVIPGAIEIPLGAISARAEELDATKRTVVYCQSGARSSVAASWMRGNGFDDVVDVAGGYEAWRKAVAPA